MSNSSERVFICKKATFAALQWLNSCRHQGMATRTWRDMYDEWNMEWTTLQEHFTGHLASDEDPADWFKLTIGVSIQDVDWFVLEDSFKSLAECD